MAAIEGAGSEIRQLVARGAGQLDRAGDSARAERTRPAAARHPHNGQTVRNQRGERNIAKEGIGHGHAVQQHQRPAGCIATQRPQGRALVGRVRRPAVRPTKLLGAGDVGQHILQPARRIVEQPLPVDRHRSIGGRTGWQAQPLSRYDDRRCIGACIIGGLRQHSGWHQQKYQQQIVFHDASTPSGVWSFR